MSSLKKDCDDNLKSKNFQQIDRIKKQEEEEQWISGEELCTEGSSEDETVVTKRPVNRQRKIKKAHHLLAGNRPPRRPSPLAQEIANPLNSESPNQTDLETSTKQSSNDEMPEEESIPWRPKRGSIKLPGFSEKRLVDIFSNTQL